MSGSKYSPVSPRSPGALGLWRVFENRVKGRFGRSVGFSLTRSWQWSGSLHAARTDCDLILSFQSRVKHAAVAGNEDRVRIPGSASDVTQRTERSHHTAYRPELAT